MKNLIWSILFFLFTLDILKKRFFEKEEIKTSNDINAEINSTRPVESNKENEKLNEERSKDIYQSRNEEGLVTLEVKYCPTTYAKTFEDFKKDLVGNYTNIEVIGSEFPVAPVKKLLSKALWLVQMGTMVLIIGGHFARNYLQFIPERVFKFIDDNKMMIGIFNFFIIGWLQNSLTATKAFEILYMKENIWSALQFKKPPTAQVIAEILSEKGVELELI